MSKRIYFRNFKKANFIYPKNCLPLWIKNFLFKNKKIPDIYREIEYLESDGNQYIDTGVLVDNNNLTIRTKVYTDDMPSAEKDFCGNQQFVEGRFVLGLYTKKVFIYTRSIDVTDTNVLSNAFSGANTLEIEANFDYVNHIKKITVNGVSTQGSYNASIINSVRNIRVFSDGPAVTSNKFIGKIYFMQIYFGDELKIDLVPVQRKSDNKKGFYDLVSKEFLTNQGTGDFL